MKITSASKRDNFYNFIFENDENEYKVIGEIGLSPLNDSEVTDTLKNALARYDFTVHNVTDAIEVAEDEQLIIIPKLYEALPEDKVIPIGDVRFYKDYCNLSNYFIDFKLNSTDCGNLDINSFAAAMMDYLHWER